jgi:hypothetical protein
VHQQPNCERISVQENDPEDWTSEDDSCIGLGLGEEIEKLFYFIPVALMLVVVYPIIYLLIYWNKMRNSKCFTAVSSMLKWR